MPWGGEGTASGPGNEKCGRGEGPCCRLQTAQSTALPQLHGRAPGCAVLGVAEPPYPLTLCLPTPPHPCSPPHPPPAAQEIASCESEATKKGVQASNTQKQLDKLRKEADKGAKEREKLAADQAAKTQVRGLGGPPCCGGWLGVGAGIAARSRGSRKVQELPDATLEMLLAEAPEAPLMHRRSLAACSAGRLHKAHLLTPARLNHPPQPRPTVQAFKEMEAAALEVLQAVREAEAALGEKDAELAEIRAEYEKKQKEVSGDSGTVMCSVRACVWRAGGRACRWLLGPWCAPHEAGLLLWAQQVARLPRNHHLQGRCSRWHPAGTSHSPRRRPPTPAWPTPYPTTPTPTPPPALLQVGIIRQVEVDIDAKLDQQRASLKGQKASLTQHARTVEEYSKKLEERDGGWAGWWAGRPVGSTCLRVPFALRRWWRWQPGRQSRVHAA